MYLLLVDIVRRWRWLFVAAALWSLVTTLYLSQSEGVPEFGVVAYVFPLFYVFWGTYYDLKNGWSRVAMTLPVPKAAIASALWVAAVLLLPGVTVVATLASIPLRPVVPAPSLLLGALRPIHAADLLLAPVFSLVVTNAMCLAAECLAETLARAGGHVGTAYAGWKANVWAIGPAVFIVPALGLIGVILYRVPLTWDMVDPLHAVALTIGVALLIPSFRYRRWLAADVSEGTLLKVKIPDRPWKRKSCKPPSYWWSAWRWHVIAASGVVAFWVLWYAIFVLTSRRNRGAASLAVDLFVDGEVLVFVTFFTAITTPVVHPMRVYRALPLSPGRLVVRLVSLPAAVYAAVVFGILPGGLFAGRDASPAFANVSLSFGACLVLLAVTLGWLNNRWGFVAGMLGVLGIPIILGFVPSVLTTFGVAAFLTIAGVWGLYVAVTCTNKGCLGDLKPYSLPRR